MRVGPDGLWIGEQNEMKIHLSLLASSLSYLDSVAVGCFFESEIISSLRHGVSTALACGVEPHGQQRASPIGLS